MRPRWKTIVAAVAVMFVATGVSYAQAVKLEFKDGRVDLSAQNVPAGAILAEWARLGGTNIVGADRITAGPMTIELTGVTEREALDIILREVPGYMVAARQADTAGASRFDRIMVVAVTAMPRPAAPPTFSTVPPPNAGAGDVATAEQEALRRADELRAREDAARRGAAIVTPGVTVQGGAPSPFAEPPAPRTEPPPSAIPGNPFMPTPGSPTPGTISPVPQQQPQNPPRPVQ